MYTAHNPRHPGSRKYGVYNNSYSFGKEAGVEAKEDGQGASAGRAGKFGYHSIVPYFVSGPLSREVSAVGIVGTFLHVAAWVISLVFFLVTVGLLEDETESASYDFWFYSFIPFAVSLAILVVLTLGHFTVWLMKWDDSWFDVREGGVAPFLMTLMCTGVKVSQVFTILQLLAGSHVLDAEWRHYIIWASLSLYYIDQFLDANAKYAGSAEDNKAALADAAKEIGGA